MARARSSNFDDEQPHEANDAAESVAANYSHQFQQPNHGLPSWENSTWPAYDDYGVGEYGPPGGHGPPTMGLLEKVAEAMLVYYTPVVAILGIIVNAAILVTFMSHRTLRRVSANQYVVGILIAETVYMLTLIHTWLSTVYHIHFYGLGGWCQFMTFSERVSTFLSMWYTVGLSVDGLIRICYSDLEFRMCTVWRSRIFMIGVAILAIIVYLNTSITVAVVWYGPFPACQDLDMFAKTLRTLAKIDVFVNCLIPSVTMLAMVASMSARLSASYRREQTLLHRRPARQSTAGASTSTWSDGSTGADLRDDNPPPRFIIAYVCAFLLFTLPKQTIYAYFIFKNFGGATVPKTLNEFLIDKILQGFPHVKSLACLVVFAAFHTALRKVVCGRLGRCVATVAGFVRGGAQPADAETYPLRGDGSARGTDTIDAHKPMSTSFLCEIEVREVNT